MWSRSALVSCAVAVVLLLAEAHLAIGGLIGAVVVVALVCGMTLLLIGATVGLLAVLALVGAVCVASADGLVLLVRSLGPPCDQPEPGHGAFAHTAPSVGLPALTWSSLGNILPLAAVVALVVIS